MRCDEFKRLLDLSVRHDWNWIKLGKNETREHKVLKVKECLKLVERDFPFMTEVKFKGGRRADIASPLDWEVIEVVVSEGQKSLAKKKIFFEGLGFEMKVVK